jgi:Heat shock protein
MKKIFGSIAIFVLVCMTSCAGSKTMEVSQLTGKWSLVSVKGETLSFANTPFFEFNIAEKSVYGKSGCNNFNSSLTFDASNSSAISFMMPRSTMMACGDMENEGKVLRSFEAVKAVQASSKEGEVVLVDEGGKEVFRLVKD